MSITIPTTERIRWIVGTLFIALAAALGAAPAHAASGPGSDGDITAIVQFKRGVDLDAARDLVKDFDGDVHGKLSSIHGVAARIPAGQALKLERSSLVLAVTKNARVKPQSVGNLNELVSTYPTTAGAKDAWTSGTATSGAGVGVAVIDTGIAGGMADFRTSASDATSRVVATAVANPLATSAGDNVGHGTHVAGIIAGNGNNRWTLDPQRGKYIGIAPDANLISVKVSDDNGEATVLDVIRGLDFVIQYRQALGIRVVNLSLSSTEPSSYKTDPLDAAVESAWKKGLVVVTAAGNRGSGEGAADYAPGNDPFAITVGSVDDNGTSAPSDDGLASWSTRGTTMDGVAKPEVYTPGVKIYAPLANGSGFALMCPTCILGSYIRASGTSMSAPMVAGMAALILERYPNLTPDQVKGSILKYGRNNGSWVSAHAQRTIAGIGSGGPGLANEGLVPNEAVNAATGDVDETRSRWSRSSWSTASGGLSADFARSSWSCADCAAQDAANAADPTRSSWSRSSWSRSSWSTWSAE